jgi:hypothetical protein
MLASLRGAILNSGAVDHQAYQQSNRVGYDVALAALDPFARIIAPTKPSARTFGSISPLGCPFRNQGTLKFCKTAQDRENELACWRGCIRP